MIYHVQVSSAVVRTGTAESMRASHNPGCKEGAEQVYNVFKRKYTAREYLLIL